jgi:hypothetical protein
MDWHGLNIKTPLPSNKGIKIDTSVFQLDFEIFRTIVNGAKLGIDGPWVCPF